MRILVAPDKFKGLLSAAEVAQNIAAGLRSALPDAQITCCPVADGGEGTASVIHSATGGEWKECDAQDPLGRRIRASYLWQKEGRTVVFDMSAVAGISLLRAEELDPLRVSTFGVGEMILEATRCGARQIIVGLGGSATNDGGFGMARALGFRFLDRRGEELRPGVPDLLRLERIERPPALRLPRIIAAADVRSPLPGPRGATCLFGRQKGATASQLELLESALTRLADVVAQASSFQSIASCQLEACATSSRLRDAPGAGAAGGLGFGLMAFGGAEMRSGFEVVAEAIELEEAVRAADIVITGEGRLDAQTLAGKAPAGVARLARRSGKKVYAIVGELEDAPGVRELFDGIYSIATRRRARPS